MPRREFDGCTICGEFYCAGQHTKGEKKVSGYEYITRYEKRQRLINWGLGLAAAAMVTAAILLSLLAE